MPHPKKTNLTNLDLRQEISGVASRKRGLKELQKIKSVPTKKKTVSLSQYFILPTRSLDFQIEVDENLTDKDILKRFKNYPVTMDLKIKP